MELRDVYFCGEIREKHRGDLAVVVSAEETEYGAFTYPVLSDECIHLTGVRAKATKAVRVYLGVSSDTANMLTEKVAENPTASVLPTLDNMVVYSAFLHRGPNILTRC